MSIFTCVTVTVILLSTSANRTGQSPPVPRYKEVMFFVSTYKGVEVSGQRQAPAALTPLPMKVEKRDAFCLCPE